jgi:hypothetical protein
VVGARRHLDVAAATKEVTSDELAEISDYYGAVAGHYAHLNEDKRLLFKPEVDDAVNALSTAERAVALDPKNLDYHLVLVEAELRLDLSARARKSLSHVTEQLQVTDAKQWLRIARLFSRMRRPEAAVEAALKGRAWVWEPPIGVGLASVLANNGRGAEAAEIVNPLEIAKIGSMNTLLALYDVLITLKDDTRALTVVRRALELEPYHPKMRQNLAWLELGSHGARPDTQPEAQQKAKTRPPGLFSRLFR